MNNSHKLRHTVRWKEVMNQETSLQWAKFLFRVLLISIHEQFIWKDHTFWKSVFSLRKVGCIEMLPIASLPPITGLVSPGLWNVDSSELGSSLVKLDEFIMLPAEPVLWWVGLLVLGPAEEEGDVDTLLISSASIVIAKSTAASPEEYDKTVSLWTGVTAFCTDVRFQFWFLFYHLCWSILNPINYLKTLNQRSNVCMIFLQTNNLNMHISMILNNGLSLAQVAGTD